MNTTILQNHEFVQNELLKDNQKIILITREVLSERLIDIKNFVNEVRKEVSSKYSWSDENEEYFLKPMDRKFDYSYMIVNKENEILNMNFVSVYGDLLHLHCMYTRKDMRKTGLSKLSIIKVCQTGIANGFHTMEGYFPKNNNGSLILFLRLGLVIDYIRNGIEVLCRGRLDDIMRNAFRLYLEENRPK